MTRKFTFLMTAMVLILAIMGPRNVAWGQTTTYTMQSYSNSIITSDNNATWTTSSPCGGSELPYALNSNRGAGFQADNTVTSSISVTNASKITVIASSNGVKTTTLAVKVGNTTFGNTVSVPKGNYQILEFTAPNNTPVSGTIVFTITRSSKTLWIGQVIVETASTTPTCTIDPTEWGFGNVEIGEQAQKTFTVTTANLTEDLTLAVSEGFSVSPVTIESTETERTVTVTCTPTAVGALDGTLTISGGGLTENVTATLSATGLCTAPTTALSYTTPVELQLTDGEAEATLAPIANTGNGGTITYELVEGDEDHFEVEESTGEIYTDAIGSYTVRATQAVNGTICGGTFDIVINVTSTSPSCSVSPSGWDFGNVAIGTPTSKTFTVTTANLTSNLTVSLYVGETTYSVTPTTISQSATSTDVTVTFTPAEVGTVEELLTISGGGLTSAVEVELSATGISPYTINYMVNGINTNPQVNVVSGTPLVFPEVSAPDNDHVFCGWVTEAINEPQDIAPEYVNTQDLTAQNDATYFAVFAEKEEDEAKATWTEITSEPETGTYAILTAFYFMKAEISNYSRFENGSETPAISNNKLTTPPADDCIWEISKPDSYYRIKNGENYAGGTDSKNQGALLADANSNLAKWSISYNNGFTIINYGRSISSSDPNNKYLRNNTTYGWATYAGSTGNAPRLFKKIVTYTYSNFCTTVAPIVISENTVWDGNFTINGNTTVTIGSGAVLTVTGTLTNTNAANLVIEDGGQLICNNEVAATVKKRISAINGGNGWYTIASPVNGSIDAPTAMTSSNEYDLYYYDEPEYTWRNHEVHGFQLANKQGYLYANGTATDIEFAGTLRAGNEANVVVNLSYASTYQKLKGFNLVGNPFAHNIIMGTNATMTNGNTGYYVVENGSNLVAETSATAIKPCQGFMVQATGEGQKITFNPGAKETQTEHEYITIAAGNGDFMDMAYICTNADEKLGKITLDNPTAKVYLRQGANDYAIAPLGEATSMVVCFKAPASGTYTINVSSDHEGVSLKDMKTGYVTYVNHSTSYTFEASENDAESRFKIMFGTTGVEENEAQMFVFQSGSNLIISGEGCVQIIDMMGRVLRSAQVESNATVSTEGLTAGAYVVRMLTAGGVQTQKVIVK